MIDYTRTERQVRFRSLRCQRRAETAQLVVRRKRCGLVTLQFRGSHGIRGGWGSQGRSWSAFRCTSGC